MLPLLAPPLASSPSLGLLPPPGKGFLWQVLPHLYKGRLCLCHLQSLLSSLLPSRSFSSSSSSFRASPFLAALAAAIC